MHELPPRFLVMAGPNGAGKSTCAARDLPAEIPYINADEIAKTLAGEPTHEAELQAARVALSLMDQAELRRETFATETTLASRTLASRAQRLQASGYRFHLFFIWTPDPDFSIARVERRVKLGGHDIPEETIRRRWSASRTSSRCTSRSPIFGTSSTTQRGASQRSSLRAIIESLITSMTGCFGTKFSGGPTMRPDKITTQQPPIPEGEEMLTAMKRGVREALQNHINQGVSVITWDAKTKQTVEIPADQIESWIEATERRTQAEAH